MSERNEATMRAIVAAFNAREPNDLFALTTTDFELDMSRLMGEWAGVYHGHDGTLQVLELFGDLWQGIEAEVVECTSAGDHVLATITLHFLGRDGIAPTARTAWLATFRGELAKRMIICNEIEEATALFKERAGRASA